VLGSICFIVVFNEVNAALADVQHQGAVMAHCNTGFDAVLFADCLDSRCQFCLHVLGNVCHFELLFVAVYVYIIANWLILVNQKVLGKK
jgi:hypothetical protein